MSLTPITQTAPGPCDGLAPFADVLAAAFRSGPCDFCPEPDALTYADPETGRRYCLPCLVTAAELTAAESVTAEKETDHASR